MQALKDCTWNEGIERLATTLGRLTLLRRLLDAGPLDKLVQLLDALNSGDVMQAAYRYHDITAELLSCGCRRVSGNLMCDYLLCELMEKSNVFSDLAAAGRIDPPVHAAMYKELSLLGSLAALEGNILSRYISERLRELKLKPRQARDTISLMSNAAWAGGATRPIPRDDTQLPPQPQLPNTLFEGEWASWRYEQEALDGSYVSDEALEEIYRRLLGSASWGACLDDLWNFHAAYGSEKFLRDRLYALDADGLTPIPPEFLPAQDDLTLYELERAELTQHVIRFMRGERSGNILLTGGPGTGKTTLVLSLVRELPAVRFVMVDAKNAEHLKRVSRELLGQPLRFLLYVDHADLSSPEFHKLRADLQCGRVGGENQLLCVSAREGDDSLFQRRIHLDVPPLKAFVEFVRNLLLKQHGVPLDYDRVQNACIDYKIAHREELSFTAAERIAAMLLDE